MNFADCLMEAVRANELDKTRADLASQEWQDLSRRYEASGYSAADARKAAADELVERMKNATEKRRHVTVRQLMTLERNQARYSKAAVDDPDLLLRDIEHAEREGRSIFKQIMGGIREFLVDHHADWKGEVRGRAQLDDIVRELHGQSSGNANAKAIADAIEQQRERLRNLFNSLGGDIRKLDDYGVAHIHSGPKIREAGFQAWADDIYGRLDWSRIIDNRTGKPFAVAPGARPFREDADRLLDEVYKNITTNGWHDRTPGFSVGAQALFNAHGEQRILHFKSADDWMAYNEAFGAQNPFQAIISQMQSMSRDIARMRAFGPNPKAGLENAIQVMQKGASEAPRNRRSSLARKIYARKLGAVQPEEIVNRKAIKARVMHGVMTGEFEQPAHETVAALAANTRNLLTAAQLGAAVFSQTTDMITMRQAAAAIGLNKGGSFARVMKSITTGIEPQVARDLGFIMDSWANAGAARARVYGDVWSPELSGRVTNVVMKLNGMEALTNHERLGVALAFGSDLAGLAGKRFDELHPGMQRFMSERSITARDWDLLRDPAVLYTDPQGGKHMNPRWFLEHSTLPRHEAEDLSIRFGGLIEAHLDRSIPLTSLRGRASTGGGSRPGTEWGEIARSFGMYKSYAFSLMFSQMQLWRELHGDFASKALFMTKFAAGMIVAGAVSVQLKELVKGRDPRQMDSAKFWGAAFMQGGGLGIFGDFFSASTSRTGGGFGEVLGGPVVGAASDISRAVGSNLTRAHEGKPPLLGRDLVNLGRRYNPAATYWPTRVALDRMLWDQLQLALDPEAAVGFAQAERRRARDYGNQAWWRPGQTAPHRAPDMSRAIPEVSR